MADEQLKLSNALQNPKETRPAKSDTPLPASTAWTHRYKPAGKPAEYELYDQIGLSPALAKKQKLGSTAERPIEDKAAIMTLLGSH